jgi:hypothetical protein
MLLGASRSCGRARLDLESKEKPPDRTHFGGNARTNASRKIIGCHKLVSPHDVAVGLFELHVAFRCQRAASRIVDNLIRGQNVVAAVDLDVAAGDDTAIAARSCPCAVGSLLARALRERCACCDLLFGATIKRPESQMPRGWMAPTCATPPVHCAFMACPLRHLWAA